MILAQHCGCISALLMSLGAILCMAGAGLGWHAMTRHEERPI